MPKREIEPADYYAMVRQCLRAAGRRAAAGDAEGLEQLLSLHRDVDQAAAIAVAGLRSSGHTWAAIGAATGTTRQAALMRWSQVGQEDRRDLQHRD